ncbi:MAG: hypothetical protein KKE02_11230 [Alphaproteobacteria bacterium]|nr:hypothetical protein [Alphaproteobacteria bacterium]MBU1512477.1 hypothetical protein [Alphaproteobacteria bacterium]MBU2096599.1 hypothetical protein [Alphaproteobacteria bacterium]MBU2151583.1 hypothetical protein [Alphaproteobacteria bacterium]MBU2307300.1 hypothetical protein [Alphaproteobacteria bacterium]
MAAELVQLFGRYIEHAKQTSGKDDRRGVAKHLVIITTRLRNVSRLDTPTALRLAARAYGEQFGPPASTLKKCASEARALLAARKERMIPEKRIRRHFDAFAEIDGQIALESAHAAAALRAARLSGRRGGRPPVGRATRRPDREPALPPERIARAIVSLKERARAGDDSAQLTLEKLRRLIAPQEP